MAKSASEILSRIKNTSGVTNINNTNNNNNTNNLTTSIIVPSEESNEVRPKTKSSSGLASLSASQKPLAPPLGGIGTLPPTWYGVKLDLFCNGVNKHGEDNLKLRLSITIEQNQVVQVDAALNSPSRYIYRGSKQQGDPQHWNCVRTYERQLKADNIPYRASKFALPGKKGSVADMACFLYKISGTWVAAVIRQGLVYEFDIDDAGSPNFIKNHGIATAYYGQGKTDKRWISVKELGI